MTIAKSVVATILVSKNSIPYYDKDKGLIIDNINNSIMYKVKFLEWSPYYYYELVFSEYISEKIYNYNNNVLQNKIHQKKYNIMFIANFTNIHNVIHTKEIMRKISCILINFVKITYLYKNFSTAKQFLETRKTTLLKMLPWNIYKFDNDVYFDLYRCKIIDSKTIQKNIGYTFKKYGGIIETNDLHKLYEKYRIKKKKTLVIVPVYTCTDNITINCTCITYNDLFSSKSNLDYIYTVEWDTLIIHEVYEKFFTALKKYIKNMTYKNLWIINSLPLHVYFNSKDSYKSISSRASLMNFWLCIDNVDKRMYKNDIINFVSTNLHLFYKRIYFQAEYKNVTTLQTTQIEKNIFDIILRFYIQWISKIETNTAINVQNIKSKITNTVYTLLTSFSDNEINYFFEQKNNYIQKVILNEKNKILNVIDNVDNNTINTCNNNYNIKQLNKHYENIVIKNRNYDRYNKIDYLNIQIDTCPICYCNFNELHKIWVITICGHSMCIECAINAISYSNECPLCREYITNDKIVTIGKDQNIFSYVCKNISNNILITNCKGLCNLEFRKNINIIVLYTRDPNLNAKMSKLIKNDTIQTVQKLFVIEENKYNNKIYQISNYLKSINIKLNVNYVKFDFNLN